VRLPVRYRAGGQPVLSVTQILTLNGRIDKQWFTEESRERGTAVHAATEKFDRGETAVLPDEWRGYVAAYAKFLATVRPTYEASEVAATSVTMQFGGRMDRLCSDLFGHPAILDLKTGPPSPWHGQQLAGYNTLRPTGARYALYLKRDGKYRLMAYDDPMDHRKFMFDLAAAYGQVTAEGDYWQVAA
jgi:hypothetical protein